ncbi:hypothetical protein D9X91_05030 [Falsibacillus albus]|uniref:Uncharacterized protein n=1 Tax=Falsibacillus albus TaxID=2478915 RepID=A0A3L7K384_9BACI|nr:hypothetical protein D9X91_05030 [Falsibacillus albus]
MIRPSLQSSKLSLFCSLPLQSVADTPKAYDQDEHITNIIEPIRHNEKLPFMTIDFQLILLLKEAKGMEEMLRWCERFMYFTLVYMGKIS